MMRHRFVLTLLILLAFTGVAIAEQEWLPGYGDKNGRLGKKDQSWRIGWINTLSQEGATSNDFETTLSPVDPTQDNSVLLPDSTGIVILNSGGEDLLNTTLVDGILNGTTVVEGTLDMSDELIDDVGSIMFNTTDGLPCTEGLMFWNDDDGTNNLGLKGSNVCLQIGQEQVVRGKNTTGGSINNGVAVFINGASGTNPEFGLSDADNLPNSKSIGLATEIISSNQFGYSTTFGLVREIDTSGTPVSEVWAAGDEIYVGNTAGELTNVMPTDSGRKTSVGFVVKANATEGTIWTHPDSAPYFSELSGAVLAEGSVLFIDAFANTTEDNANLTWDDTNDELIVSNMANEAEMFISEVTIALAAGGAWANITGMTNGLMSATGMIQNATDGSVTISDPGRYKSVLGASIEDNDGPAEEYHMSMAVNGVEIEKCEQHRSVSNQAALGAITVPCMLDLSANDVVTALANSVGGDDLTFEHLHWLLFK